MERETVTERFRATIATLSVAAAIVGCSKPAAHPELVRPVRTIKVGDLSAMSGREFPGRAKAKEEVELSFQISGPLVSLPVDVGTTVKKGDVIAAVDPRDFQVALDSNQGNLERARANLLAMERGARPEEIERLKAEVTQAEASQRQAVAEHERNAKLVTGGAVSKTDFDVSLARQERTTAEVISAKESLNIGLRGARAEDLDAKRSEIRVLEAAVANAKNQLEYAVLAAPFDGEVAARYVDNYQTVQAKQSIVRLLDVSKIEVTIQVPEGLIALAPQVKKVACRFDALPNREFFGQVTKIGSEASQTTRTYPVIVQLDQPQDARILPGMAATVRNHAEESTDDVMPDLIVPAGAVFTEDAARKTYVWVADEASKTVARREIKTGALTPVGLVVVEGLKAGELVVAAGVNSLHDGQEVAILNDGT